MGTTPKVNKKPKYNNSKIVIFVNYGANLTNSSSDGGFGTRFKRAISGGASTDLLTGGHGSTFGGGVAPATAR